MLRVDHDVNNEKLFLVEADGHTCPGGTAIGDMEKDSRRPTGNSTAHQGLSTRFEWGVLFIQFISTMRLRSVSKADGGVLGWDPLA